MDPIFRVTSRSTAAGGATGVTAAGLAISSVPQSSSDSRVGKSWHHYRSAAHPLRTSADTPKIAIPPARDFRLATAFANRLMSLLI
jgi:hypothetical protein